MTDHSEFRTQILARLKELGARIHEIDEELGHEKTRDLSDQAIDLEDDEVLESLGQAAEIEVGLLRAALRRIEEGTFGTCLSCGEPISEERLRAVPHAPLCRNCVAGVSG